jgi:signal transduction histidine kinase
MPKLRSAELPFKPRARLLPLLGDQLIRDPEIAVFELVKNSYDADSRTATVIMSGINDPKHGSIVVRDSGTGMDWQTVTEVWLEPGTDHRVRQREAGERTPRFKRLPLGEKGVGRFAAHKLGERITLVTRKKDCAEVVAEFDWRRFLSEKHLSDVPVTIEERDPEVFEGEKTGTRIEVTQLRQQWTRGMIRDLARAVMSICSPFEEAGSFKTKIVLRDNEDWLEGLLTLEDVRKYSLFRAECTMSGGKLEYEYHFEPWEAMEKVTGRTRKVQGREAKALSYQDGSKIDLGGFEIGTVKMQLLIFDLDPQVLALGVTDRKGLRKYLGQNGGIRVYRDGIRVYDYGEPGNDWLNLGGRRVNVPAVRISNNLVIGAVSLDLASSADLVEKTNREGFVENDAFSEFQAAVLDAVTQIEWERQEDKERIRNAYSGKKSREPIIEDLTAVRKIAEEKLVDGELTEHLDRIERQFLEIRDRFLVSASAGLSLTVVIHEVEKGVKELLNAIDQENSGRRVRELARHLADLIEGFAALARGSGSRREKASGLINKAVFNTELRLKHHQIRHEIHMDEGDFEAVCSRRLIISTLMNIIDNSIWWLRNKWGENGRKRLYIGTSRYPSKGGAIVIADNGPGFSDSPEYLTAPFFSRKPDGSGLGLHIADQVMRVNGGRLDFPEPGDIDLPEDYTGAVVALVFREAKWIA